MKNAVVYLLSLYQKIGIFSGHCRHYPTCSEYMKQAVDKYGAIKGLGLGFSRLLRCNQFFSGGEDPVR